MINGSIPALDLQTVAPFCVIVNPSILGPIGTRTVESLVFVS